MSIFDTLKSVVGNLDGKMLDPIVGKIGAIDFSPILSKLDVLSKNDSKINILSDYLKKLSHEKPQNASQFIDITKGFDAKALSEALSKVEKLEVPGLQALAPLLKNFIK